MWLLWLVCLSIHSTAPPGFFFLHFSANNLRFQSINGVDIDPLRTLFPNPSLTLSHPEPYLLLPGAAQPFHHDARIRKAVFGHR